MNKTVLDAWKTAPTSEQKVAAELSQHILEGRLPIGEFLSQRKLAQLTGSSVISVRGAVRQLENEGLVENIPRMGIRIPQETPAAIRDRYLIRHALETTAVERIFGNLSDEEKDQLLQMANELDRLVNEHTEENAKQFARLHHELHLRIAEGANSPLLIQMLKRVINPSLMMLNATRSWKAPAELTQNHTELVEFIMGENLDQAIQAIQAHIQVGLESELAAL